MVKYYEISETLAKRAKENHSFDDYSTGKATSEYQATVNKFYEQVEAAKKRVQSDDAIERLDRLADRFARRLADWYNRKNATDSGHVSVMLAGPANYPMGKQRKWEAAQDRIWKEYNAIMALKGQVHSIVNGDSIIHSDDADAESKLKQKIEAVKARHDKMKADNVEARKKGELAPYSSYYLQLDLREVKRLEGRLKSIQREKEKAVTATPESTTAAYEAPDGVQVVENAEVMRIQLLFDGKPDEKIRDILKSRGFRWAPSQMAWQRQLNSNGRYAAKRALEQIKEVNAL